jgi:hypothetical protein
MAEGTRGCSRERQSTNPDDCAEAARRRGAAHLREPSRPPRPRSRRRRHPGGRAGCSFRPPGARLVLGGICPAVALPQTVAIGRAGGARPRQQPPRHDNQHHEHRDFAPKFHPPNMPALRHFKVKQSLTTTFSLKTFVPQTSAGRAAYALAGRAPYCRFARSSSRGSLSPP